MSLQAIIQQIEKFIEEEFKQYRSLWQPVGKKQLLWNSKYIGIFSAAQLYKYSLSIPITYSPIA